MLELSCRKVVTSVRRYGRRVVGIVIIEDALGFDSASSRV